MNIEKEGIMELDRDMARLICEIEYIIGNQTYNPNSHNGWTDEDGCDFRYPVSYCERKKGVEKKTKLTVEYIDPDCISSMKYAFGSNHLYIGNGIYRTLDFLEKTYGLDFKKLEKARIRRKKLELKKIIHELDEGKEVSFNSGRKEIGIEIPAGEYSIINDDFYKSNNWSLSLLLYDKQGVEKERLEIDQEMRVNLKRGWSVKTYGPFRIRK